LLALSLSYWRDNNKDMDAHSRQKNAQNPYAANATMQRKDDQGKAVSEITIYICSTQKDLLI
jgi:hypothetical protein